MDYKQTADQIKQAVGGSQNIESVAHCATRLRLVLKDDSQANKAEVEKIEGVKGAFTNSGQFQIIIGQGAVNKVYEAFVGGGDIQQATAEEQKKAAAQKLNWFQRFARTLSNIFVPIIPVIVASGVLMGLLGMLSNFGVISPDTGVYKLLDMISNAAFTFLPVLIAYSAAKEFGCNPYLAAILGAIMIHPNLQNAWTMGTTGVETQYLDFFGFQVAAIGYQGQVLPVLIAVLLMAFLEKRIHKIMPNCLDLLLTPFFTLLITAVATFFVIGPVGRLIGDGISIGLQYLYTNLGPVAGLIFGGTYSLIVITGMHHSFHAVETGLLANPAIGVNFLLPIWSMANVAQGGAALAVYCKTRNKTLKTVAAPASFSCLLGITEAAIFGVNLKLVRPFIGALIGGALGGFTVVLAGVGMSGIGVTGIPGLALVAPQSMVMYIIGMAVAFAGAFAATWIMGFKEETGA